LFFDEEIAYVGHQGGFIDEFSVDRGSLHRYDSIRFEKIPMRSNQEGTG
jgi:hypothetical protein